MLDGSLRVCAKDGLSETMAIGVVEESSSEFTLTQRSCAQFNHGPTPAANHTIPSCVSPNELNESSMLTMAMIGPLATLARGTLEHAAVLIGLDF